MVTADDRVAGEQLIEWDAEKIRQYVLQLARNSDTSGGRIVKMVSVQTMMRCESRCSPTMVVKNIADRLATETCCDLAIAWHGWRFLHSPTRESGA